MRETRAGNGVFPLAGPARLKKAGRGARIVEAIGPEAEERYLAFIENAADGVVMVENGVHVYANRRFLDMFGFDDEREIVGKPLSALVHPEDLDRIAGYVGRDVSEEAPTRRKKSGAGARIYEF
ncbi:MAG: PAS domain S-box protein, partial [Syntrophorhabdales bacterium]